MFKILSFHFLFQASLKKAMVGGFFCFIALAWLSTAHTKLLAEEILLEKIYYFVNDDVVTKLDFEEAFILTTTDPVFTEISQTEISNIVMSNLITERIIAYNAENEGIRVRDEDVNNEIAHIMQRNNISSHEHFATILASQGLSFNVFKKRIRKNLLTSTYLSKSIKPNPPTDIEIRRHYQENRDPEFVIQEPLYRLSWVFLESSTRKTFSERRAIQTKAERIREDIISNVTRFETAVATYSEDNASKTKQGLLPWQRSKDLPISPDALAILRPLPISSITPLFSSGTGIFFYRIEDKLTSGYIPFNIVANDIRQKIIQETQQDAIGHFMDDLMLDAFIRPNVNYFSIDDF